MKKKKEEEDSTFKNFVNFSYKIMRFCQGQEVFFLNYTIKIKHLGIEDILN